MAATTACTALCTAATIGGTVVAVPALGFTSVGVAAGSLASWFQSAYLAGTIASGSLFATLQSVGAGGLASATYAKLTAACAAYCAVAN